MLRCSVANLIPSDYCGFKSGLADALAQRVPASPRALAIDRAAASRISEKKYSTRGEDMGIKLRAVLAAFGMVAAVTAMSVQAQTKPTIKLIYTDPLSGPFAQVGDANLKQWQYVISYINATGGALGRKFELIPFDSKTQPRSAAGPEGGHRPERAIPGALQRIEHRCRADRGGRQAQCAQP